mgnify:CR=1 FL=1
MDALLLNAMFQVSLHKKSPPHVLLKSLVTFACTVPGWSVRCSRCSPPCSRRTRTRRRVCGKMRVRLVDRLVIVTNTERTNTDGWKHHPPRPVSPLSRANFISPSTTARRNLPRNRARPRFRPNGVLGKHPERRRGGRV